MRTSVDGCDLDPDFRPGDTVMYEINENYREADKPFFSKVELKGGGDATSAARAVLQTGETDYSWNLQVEKAVLDQLMADAETGSVVITLGNSVEQLLLNEERRANNQQRTGGTTRVHDLAERSDTGVEQRILMKQVFVGIPG